MKIVHNSVSESSIQDVCYYMKTQAVVSFLSLPLLTIPKFLTIQGISKRTI